MRYRLQRHDGTDCSATMVPITVLRMVPIQRYRQLAEYIETESGKKSNSLQLLAALAMYRKTNSILIVAKLDRLSRNV